MIGAGNSDRGGHPSRLWRAIRSRPCNLPLAKKDCRLRASSIRARKRARGERLRVALGQSLQARKTAQQRPTMRAWTYVPPFGFIRANTWRRIGVPKTGFRGPQMDVIPEGTRG